MKPSSASSRRARKCRMQLRRDRLSKSTAGWGEAFLNSTGHISLSSPWHCVTLTVHAEVPSATVIQERRGLLRRPFERSLDAQTDTDCWLLELSRGYEKGHCCAADCACFC